MSELKRMKIKILSEDHFMSVKIALRKLGYDVAGAEYIGNTPITLFTYEDGFAISARTRRAFENSPAPEFQMKQETSFVRVEEKKYQLSLADGELFVNGCQVDMDEFAQWVTEKHG